MSKSRAFTLIEVMVVVAIIGLLASVVLSALRDARFKAADAAVRREATELRTIMELERTNTGTYTAIKAGGAWKAANSSCTVGSFSGQFAERAADVCTKMVAASSVGSRVSTGAASVSGCGANCLYFQTVNVSGQNSADRYAIQAYLPYASIQAGAARWLCLGSSNNQSLSDGAAWTEDGCYQNP